jgi:hypothetical protein
VFPFKTQRQAWELPQRNKAQNKKVRGKKDLQTYKVKERKKGKEKRAARRNIILSLLCLFFGSTAIELLASALLGWFCVTRAMPHNPFLLVFVYLG